MQQKYEDIEKFMTENHALIRRLLKEVCLTPFIISEIEVNTYFLFIVIYAKAFGNNATLMSIKNTGVSTSSQFQDNSHRIGFSQYLLLE